MATIKTTVIRFVPPVWSRLPLDKLRHQKWSASRDPGKVSSEVLQRLGRAGVDAHLEQGIAFLPARALNGHGQPGLLSLLREDQRRKLLGTGAENETWRRGISR